MERTVYSGRAYGIRYNSASDLILITRHKLVEPWRACDKGKLRVVLWHKHVMCTHYESATDVSVGHLCTGF